MHPYLKGPRKQQPETSGICMKHFLRFVTSGLILFAGHANATTFHTNDADRNAGDIIQLALPLAGLGLTWLKDDPEGRKPWAYSILGTALSTQVLKEAFAHTALGERPNGGHYSFPSGHVSSSCAASVFMGRRYGWSYGAPALVAAGFVAYSRVDEELHHWRDVIAGCALGAAFSFYLVPSLNPDLVVMPTWSGTNPAIHVVLRF